MTPRLAVRSTLWRVDALFNEGRPAVRERRASRPGCGTRHVAVRAMVKRRDEADETDQDNEDAAEEEKYTFHIFLTAKQAIGFCVRSATQSITLHGWYGPVVFRGR